MTHRAREGLRRGNFNPNYALGLHHESLYQFCFSISHIFKFIKAITSLEILMIAKAILAFSTLYLI